MHRIRAIGHGLTSEEKDRGNYTDAETEASVHKEVGNLFYSPSESVSFPCSSI